MRDVVFQMNKFRVALVCHQMKDLLQSKVKLMQKDALSCISAHSRH